MLFILHERLCTRNSFEKEPIDDSETETFRSGTSHNLHLLNKPIPAGSGSLTFRDTY